MGVFIVWLLFAGLVGWLADTRGRSGFGYFLLAAVLSPLIGLIAVLVLPNLRQQDAEKQDAVAAQRREHERKLEEIRAITAAAGSASSAPSTSVADELEKLAQLKERGVLTQEEFEAQKKRLLASA